MSTENSLSEREMDVLRLVAEGMTNREIAQQLSISHNTVKVHLSNIFEKIGVTSRTEATVYAIEHRIVNVPGGEGQAAPASGIRELVRQFRWVWLAMLILLLLISLTISTNLVTTGSLPETVATLDVSERWQELAPMPEPRVGMAAVAYSGDIYVIGGRGQDGVSGSVFIYNIESNKWKKGKEKPIPVFDVDGVLIGEKIYVPGGRGEDGEPTNILEIYDPRSDTWELGPPIPETLYGYAIADYEGLIYLFGGWNGEEPGNRVYIYDPTMSNWFEGSTMQPGRYETMAAVSDGEIIIIGGTTNGQDTLLIANGYLPNRDKPGDEPWVTVSNPPDSLWAPIFGVEEMGDLIILVAPIREHVFSFLFYYPQKDQWIDSSEVESELISVSSSSVSSQGYLYLLGGVEDDGTVSSNVLRYQGLFITAFPNISQ